MLLTQNRVFIITCLRCILYCASIPLLANTVVAKDSSLDFENDIVAIFTKAGCNAGECHGAAIGRGGFKLSLYGGNPAADFEAIVNKLQGRRINLSKPEQSLLLLKPTEYVSHEGGAIFDMNSESARRIKQWISQGAKRVTQRKLVSIVVRPARIYTEQLGTTHQISVNANYSDGSTRNVSDWAVLEPEDNSAVESNNTTGSLTVLRRGRHIVTVRYLTIVRPIEIMVPLNSESNTEVPPVYNYIDTEINKTLQTLRIKHSAQATDGEFIRRISLHLTGRLPSAKYAKEFISSSDEEKRSKAIDTLLGSEEFNIYWSHVFSELLRIRPQALGPEGASSYFDWLSDRIRANANYKQIVTELLLSTGDAFEHGPANYYRTITDPRRQAEFTSELLMGTRLRCANCHNHPLDHWTQNDYHGLAAIFAQLDISQSVKINLDGTTIHPVTLEPAIAKIPAGKAIQTGATDPRKEFAQWLTADNNPYFAKAIVNRLWKQMMGRGLVEPVDDFRSTNPATHPLLMDALAQEFVTTNYNIKGLLKTIALSSAYQRSSAANESNKYDNKFYSHTLRTPLQPAVHADATSDVLQVAEQYGEQPLGTRAIELLNPVTQSRTLDILGRCGREDSCETGNNASSGLTKTLHFFNGGFLNSRISHTQGRLLELMQKDIPSLDIIIEYYLAAYSRFPTTEEVRFWTTQLKEQPDANQRQEFLEDFIWGLLTSKDFTTNH
ncbi:MAG: hypothetical protein CMJ76_10730 [Planctomycetaceae bacterium]|nr:hypothetical protein [Planctomycetaceae bacterium]